MQQVKQTLYGDPKGGKVKQWSIYVDGDKVVVEWGRYGGKLQTKETVCKGKNIGRSNETTPEQQALLEAEAKWTKQHDNKLYRPTVEAAKEVGQLLPMLAIDGSKKPEKIKFPCDKQPKLDGVRCTVFLEGGEVKAISRQGKFYELNSELKDDLKRILTEHSFDKLDGELYIHGEKLQNIVSAVRNTKNPMHEQVQFHVFDVPMLHTPWSERSKALDSIMDTNKVIVVSAWRVSDMDAAKRSVLEFMEEGFEGAILRNRDGLYEFNHRSNDLIKLKIMQDSEALVIDCTEDKNGEGVLTCKWRDVKFDVKMKGYHEERLFDKQKSLIGEWINFSYQALTEAGKPQFPVGNYVRPCDPEGNPLN